jgi:predicted nucleic acid-binding protein
MNVYLDTNSIIADAVADHPHHANAVALFREILRRRRAPVICAPGLAETCAVLSGPPFSRSISPAEAWTILQENVLPLFEIVPLQPSDYTEVLKSCAAQGWVGGRIFDAIHICAARKAHCARICTFNVSDFRSIAPDLHDRILRP